MPRQRLRCRRTFSPRCRWRYGCRSCCRCTLRLRLDGITGLMPRLRQCARNWAGVMSPVRRQRPGIHPLDQDVSLAAIRYGTCCSNRPERQTMRSHGRMQFRVETPLVRPIGWITPCAPAAEPPVGVLPVSAVRRQVSPGHPRVEDPQHRIKETLVVPADGVPAGTMCGPKDHVCGALRSSRDLRQIASLHYITS